ncbi:hypothetical protein [Chitinophaga nivalis]|uniref:Uncharacterized protein n=1 Tax=Chitinophaga nivalis TaxID=2991709 RepID=A0ABT3INX3_9BACT|nr:hypothetical protein [Chitinophaga nivalis]MCW3464824.1 hypothetical protein [Chitinophaga nivalis]MCW3485485.1 hypothetical protein [Chitinophaga nivalis]
MYNRHDRYYLGETLETFTLRMEAPPFYHPGTKGHSSHYRLKATGYYCQFRLSNGAYAIIDEDKAVKDMLTNLQANDTIAVAIRANDSDLLTKNNSEIRIMGLTVKGVSYIQPEIVASKDWKTCIINFSVCIGALLIGIVIFFYKKMATDKATTA